MAWAGSDSNAEGKMQTAQSSFPRQIPSRIRLFLLVVALESGILDANVKKQIPIGR